MSYKLTTKVLELVEQLIEEGYGGNATLRQLVGDAENISSALLKRVEGRSLIDGKTIREGSVFRCFTDSSFSFKVVNNQFLLKGGD